MMEKDIIIIGAGAAGLMCGRVLAQAGKKIMILEARDRVGGRINTVIDKRFPMPVELGAEFIHGDLPVTKKLLHDAGLTDYETKGDLWRSQRGEFVEQHDFIENIDEVVKQLKKLPSDIGVTEFLDTYFNEEKYVMLRKTLKSYVEGYNAANAASASSFALLQQLLGEDERQYRVRNGYVKLTEYLLHECLYKGASINYQKEIKEISWTKGNVKLVDQLGTVFTASKAVITLPLGVLQENSRLIFSPQIKEAQNAINRLGFGTVIKVVMNFDEPIWKLATNTRSLAKSDPGFIFSDAIIPTWWTQFPEKNNMISGWLAGPNAERLEKESGEKIRGLALESLAVIFNIPRKTLESKLLGDYFHNWSMDEFSRGAYSYETIHSKNAKKILSTPIKDTLYFAGEAYYEGPASGTVEAALVTGEMAANKILENFSR